MSEYAYAFKLYDNGNVINEGYHYVIASDINQAQYILKRTFPNSMILSYHKMSEKPMTRGELNNLLSEWRDAHPIRELVVQ